MLHHSGLYNEHNNFIIILTYTRTQPLPHPSIIMTTFAQTTIHSKNAKFEKTSIEDANAGRVVKGVNTEFGLLRKLKQEQQLEQYHKQNQSQIMKQIEVLPKSKLNISRKMKNQRVIPLLGKTKNEEIILMESSAFPAIYFKKTSLRNVLKQFSFPENCEEMLAEDARTVLIFQIISHLFHQINFYIFNILACQNIDNNSYYIFFSDCQTLPFTKCCNAPVFVQLQENGSGKLLCNSNQCKHPNLAEFLINFDDGKKLWPNVTYFSQASYKDKELKQKISRLIINGKYKRHSLVEMVQDTSKEIVNLFYLSKKHQKKPSNTNINIMTNDQNTFLTGAGLAGHQLDPGSDTEDKEEYKHRDQVQNAEEQDRQEVDLLQEQDTNIQTLKMKLKYITKMQTDMSKRISKAVVQDSKVFQQNFDIIRKIDEQMLKNRNSKTSSKISFPQLMGQIQKFQRTRRNSQNRTFNV